MSDRGSAFLAVMTTIVVLLLISGVIFKLAVANYKIESSEEKALKAYYLAEAGIQYGLAKILHEDIKYGDPLPPPEIVSDPFDQGKGSFEVMWEDNGDGFSFTVTSTGTYAGVVRKLQAGYLYLPNDEEEEEEEN